MKGFFWDDPKLGHTVRSAPAGMSNADIISEAASLYIDDGMVVADVTYGSGVFWRKTGTPRFTLLKSDISDRVDFRHLPYENQSIDVVVLDPPYIHDAATHMTSDLYNSETTRGMNHDGIMNLYFQLMIESVRVLKPGGQLWVKCKDEIESGIQRWSHIEIFTKAEQLGLYARDLFILIPSGRTPGHGKAQTAR
jgi:hypothetical protein